MTRNQFESDILKHQHKLFRYAISRLGDVEAAKDVVQEVLLRLWKKKDDLATVGNMEAYCMTITKNVCLDRFRKRDVATVDIEQGALRVVADNSPTETLENKDLILIVKEVLKFLPEDQQEIFRLREILGYSNVEIAELLNINPTQVKVYLFRARKKIRERLIQRINYGVEK